MGSGKGAPEYWVAVVKPGRVLFEIAGVSEEVAREALRLAKPQAALQDQVRCPVSRRMAESMMKASEIRELTAEGAVCKAR